MTFLHLGLAMAAAACVAIPVAIHLLMRRRRKPVMWGAMRFLVEAYRRQRKRLMLEQWILLATRCLLVLLLGLAIARPLLGGLGRTSGGRTVYLLIDNGLAATAAAGDASAADNALARHKRTAERILEQLAAGQDSEIGDRVALIAMGGPSEGIVIPPSGDIDAVRRLAAGLMSTDSRTDINGAIALAATAIQTEQDEGGGDDGGRARRILVVVLSDFLDGSAEVDSALARLPDGVTLLASRPPEAGGAGVQALENVAITGVEPLRSLVVAGGGEGAGGAGEQVRVTLKRSGASLAASSATTVRVRVTRPGEDAGAAPRGLGDGRGVVRFEPGQEEGATVVPVTIGASGAEDRAGLALLEAEIDADAVSADNRWRRPVEVRQALRVGVVSLRRFGELGRADQLSPAEWLRLALRPAAGTNPLDDAAGAIEVQEIEPAALDVGRLARLDALVLPRPDLLNDDMWRRIRGFVDGGGLVIVTPPAEATVHVWSDAMTRELGLPWTLPREAVVYGAADGEGTARGQGASLAPAPLAPGAGASGSMGTSGGGDVLALLRPELEELTRPITVFRALPLRLREASAEEGEAGAGGTSVAASERLLTLSDGSVFLWAGQPGGPEGADRAGADAGRGLVVYLGAALDLSWTDLPARPLMVPLVQELVRQGIGAARGSWWGLAGRGIPVPGRSVELLRIQERAGRGEEPGAGPSLVRIDANGMPAEFIRHAGIWRAVDDRGGTRGVIAVNADPRGGNVTPQAAADIQRWLRAGAGGGEDPIWLDTGAGSAAPGQPGAAAGGGLAAVLAGDDQGPPISLPLLLAAAALAVFELVFARWASHADVGSAGGAAMGGAGA